MTLQQIKIILIQTNLVKQELHLLKESRHKKLMEELPQMAIRAIKIVILFIKM